ncbi:hypothetical protein ABB37_04861 [Leptomonas pyrrhocoris]|uniref:Uncharacterized protein n=1 Tax=Leptomonas pyrrhocoris TaxID=157538 RepID=A0A0M9G1X8_LEPPY|nr:hypothetical protein ABB37_04861 [Leptomonas pyrrhocoris]XP_015659124.1 hypothetical protein ABB37_04861 [Leptomonas pyrrhocoris]KPA80684.1 hypothetical protein ABB37_04861 [Leptomonas pyrrhocoris]KPA80685.1 hypothetical protein ABB37_04861 [Leptomonas pyrrhocoris]|eukprot:XP_015659123.1 hypothetical protein ABB37_04861 [Leptomonas pyrrhocoris]
MFRDRIRVRPAGGRPSFGSRDVLADDGMDGEDGRPYRRQGAAADNAFASSLNFSHRGEASSSADFAAAPSGEAWPYACRVARLALDTVSSVFGALGTRAGDEAKVHDGFAGTTAVLRSAAAPPTLSSPTVPPNTPYDANVATPPTSHFHCAPSAEGAYSAEPAEGRPSGLIERRSARGYAHDYSSARVPLRDQPAMDQPNVAAAPRAAGSVYFSPPPSVREAPQYQITVNQYFAAPERSAYPVVATAPSYLEPRRSTAVGYRPRVSLLTVPSAIHPHTKRERSTTSATATTRASEALAAKAAKTTSTAAAVNALDVSLSNAPSAIPLGSPENSLTVPISFAGSGGSAPLFGRAKKAEESAPAKPAESGPLFGAKSATPVTPAFVFGAKPAATTTTATTPASAQPFGGFVKKGPPAVVADDYGFAPNADDGDADDSKNKDADSATTAAKPLGFSFHASGLKPAFASPGTTTTATTASAPAKAAPLPNPFSFSPKPKEKTGDAPPASTTDSATTSASAAPKGNGFVKAGPPAVMPDDDGFASGADSDDEDEANAPAKTESATATKPLGFTFNSASFKPAFNSGSPPPSTAPKPFSFAAKPAETAAPPAAPFGSFVKAGPPAVMPDDSGFASNADSGGEDGEDNVKKTKTDTATRATAPFSFSANATGVAKPAFGTGGTTFGSSSTPVNNSSSPFTFAAAASSPSSAEAPANPFKFTPSPTAGSPSAATFGSTGSSPFGTGQSVNFTFGKPK